MTSNEAPMKLLHEPGEWFTLPPGTEIPAEVAKAWRTYVQNVSQYTEKAWEAARVMGLAEFREVRSTRWNGEKAKYLPHVEGRWILTEAGLDLYTAGGKA
jgi:hypothetical protein